MRKWQQEKVLEILESLRRIHNSIKSYISCQKYEDTLKLLTECQESAIVVGETIEEIEGRDCAVISYLEEYCENLYIISQEMIVRADGNKAFMTLNENIQKIRESIKNDVTIRKEVVFFPYKISMWDSLESIFMAAQEDPLCDVYCIPIPYFDKNQDGSFREMHYEGYDYPKDIHITDWESYSLEERRPDIIYIHNPYDEFNFVTSVHPRFYASNLCKYTNMLVYVPYFVLGEINPDDKDTIDGMKHFCYMPGTIYSHKVILQSENMRQIYINEYMKVVQEQGRKADRNELEKRFLGIGSPKFDVVLNADINDIDIPEEWRKLITKQDGNRKKIILYNISISGMLQFSDNMIEKIRYVLSVFKNNRKEVVLWWRPHPLIEATILSMRPDLWEKYDELVKRFKDEGWGIYDDTTDVHRAIEVSDAYYGDKSSLICMFQRTGKPVMIHSVETDEIFY